MPKHPDRRHRDNRGTTDRPIPIKEAKAILTAYTFWFLITALIWSLGSVIIAALYTLLTDSQSYPDGTLLSWVIPIGYTVIYWSIVLIFKIGVPSTVSGKPKKLSKEAVAKIMHDIELDIESDKNNKRKYTELETELLQLLFSPNYRDDNLDTIRLLAAYKARPELSPNSIRGNTLNNIYIDDFKEFPTQEETSS